MSTIHRLPTELTQGPDGAFVRPGVVLAVGADDALRVAVDLNGRRLECWATPTLGIAEPPAPGARVLVAGEGSDICYVVGLLADPPSDAAERIETGGGASASVVDTTDGQAIAVHDPAGRLVFEYQPDTGRTVVNVPTGDLVLAAPDGDIELVSGQAIRCRSETELDLSAPHLNATAERGTFLIADTTFQGVRLATTLEEARLVLGRLHSLVDRSVERVRNAFRTVEKLYQVKAGRMRTVVEDSYSVRGGHASLKADKDVRIDGEKIHLG